MDEVPELPARPPFRTRERGRLLPSYAQNQEDVRLARVLWDREPGYYVDVGAGDPTRDSVTRLFYEAGWTGINIEPGPAYERLVRGRPRDVNLRLAIARQRGVTSFWVVQPWEELSSLRQPNLAGIPSGARLERVQVEAVTLAEVIRDHRPPGCELGFLKIDTEGTEGDVLASVDLTDVRPTVLVVESVAPGSHEPTHSLWEGGVLAAGFRFAAFDGVNRFYVPEERADLISTLAYPVSALDHYRSLTHGQEMTAGEKQLLELCRRHPLIGRLISAAARGYAVAHRHASSLRRPPEAEGRQ